MGTNRDSERETLTQWLAARPPTTDRGREEFASGLRRVIREGAILDPGTLELSVSVLKQLDSSRGVALSTAVREPYLSPQELRSLGWTLLGPLEKVISQEELLDLSGDTLTPSKDSQVHFLGGYGDDNLTFLHCTQVVVRQEEGSAHGDPVLPFYRTLEGKDFVRRVLPAHGGLLAAEEEAKMYRQLTDERKLRAFERAGENLARIQAELEDEDLSLLDLASIHLISGLTANEMTGGNPDGRRAMRKGFNSLTRGLPAARVERRIQEVLDDLTDALGIPTERRLLRL